MKLLQTLKDKFVFKPIIQACKRANSSLEYQFASQLLTDKCLTCKESGVSDDKLCDQEVIVSLTTFGKRLYDVYVTIESIMQGTMKPNRIILWLDDDIKDKQLPITLQKQMARGLEICYSHKIRSFQKLIPTLRNNPEAVIVTIDDDLIYKFDLLEKLVNAYNCNPNQVYANRVHRIALDKDGFPLPYNSWEWGHSKEGSSKLNFLTGVGGVLYPPYCFPQEVFNEEAFTTLCPAADDVWFYAMLRLNGKEVCKVYTHDKGGADYLLNEDVQDVGLQNTNIKGVCQNDIQIKSVFEKYGIYDLLS